MNVRMIHDDQRGSAAAYLVFLAIVVIGAFAWILVNEMVLHVGDWVDLDANEDNGGVWDTLVIMLRFTPVVIMLAAFVWAIVQGHQGVRF